MRQTLRTASLSAAALVSQALLVPLLAISRFTGRWQVPILAYHQVAESGSSPGYPWRVTPAMFESQMRLLAVGGYRVMSLAEFLHAHQAGRVTARSLVLTFDDGFRGVLLHAYPILKRYGFPATLFLATGYMGRSEFPWIRPWMKSAEDPEEYRPLSWEEVRAMNGPLVSLGSHTVTHPHLGHLHHSEMAWEVGEARRQIEQHTGTKVCFFAYPGGIGLYGDHTAETRESLLAEGYSCALVSEVGRNGLTADPLRLRRLGVGVEDSLALFRAKVEGAFSWVRAMQWVAHRVFSDSSHY
jgi:peptidoglycan/xylan/chitin deacetylase (PgdA/CDA1 family)